MNEVAPQPEKPLDAEAFSRSSVVMVTTVPAGKSVSFSQYGEAFYFITLTAPLEVKTEQTAFKPYRKGTGERFPEGLRFKRLEIRNLSAFDISFQLWIGFGQYIDTTAEVVESYTKLVGSALSDIPALGEVEFDGAPTGFQIQRKQIVISNLDLANPVYVKDENDNFCAACQPGFSITLPVSGYVKFVNTTASPIPVCISEIWYVFQP